MGIMLILKGATYTPPTNNNTPGGNQGGNNQGNTGDNNQGSQGGNTTHQWQVLQPLNYRDWDQANHVISTKEAIIQNGDVHRLRVDWEIPDGCTSVKVHFGLLTTKYAFEFSELNSVPTASSIGAVPFVRDYVIKDHPEDAQINEWYDPANTLPDCIFTPLQNACALSINICMKNHDGITGSNVAEILNIVDRLVEVY